MRNKKAIFAGALMVPALALTGGLAYASTTPGSPPAVTRTAVTSTVQPGTQHPAGQVAHYRCDWQRGDHRCDWRGHSYQRQATQHPVTQHRGNRNHHGYQGRSGHRYQGNWGHQGGYSSQGGSGYRGGYSGNHRGDGCGW